MEDGYGCVAPVAGGMGTVLGRRAREADPPGWGFSHRAGVRRGVSVCVRVRARREVAEHR